MNRPLLKVLVVDDDEDDFIITKVTFDEIRARNIRVEWAPTYQAGFDSYMNGAHDIYFVDYLLGAKTGIDFLMETANAKIKNPVIIITGKGDHAVDKLAMSKGAADYLVKGELDAEKLERTVRYALDRFVASTKLASSEAKFRSIFERSKDMIFFIDQDGKFQDSNNSCLKILGYTKDELIGTYFQDLFENMDDSADYVKLIHSATEIIDDERILISKTGQRKTCLISLIIQLNPDEKTAIQGVIHDITKRRKIENDLVTAEKLSVTGQVVRMIGHEIRNPLTNINLSIEQIESETKDNLNINTYLDIIRRNSDRINLLITELLNSSKPAQLTRGKVPINKVVREALELIKDRLTLKHVNLKTDLNETLCDVNIDSEKVKIAILNVLVNAVEAVAEENGEILVRTVNEEDACLVEICDNGSGISPDMLGKIFDPYFSGKPKGTGLGLSTTYNVVRAHNGTIEVNSTVGKGTCFLIKFNYN
jgi:PAS domain S-box-containing protein